MDSTKEEDVKVEGERGKRGKWKGCNLRGLEDENSRKTRIIAFRYTTNLSILLLPRSTETTFLKFLFSAEDKNLFLVVNFL